MAILAEFISDKAATMPLSFLLPACIVGLVSPPYGMSSWLTVITDSYLKSFVHFLYAVLYQLFFNPLRKFPGPKLWAVSIMPYVRMHLQGQSHQRILELHQKYGPIVRIGPDFLSFNHPDAMKEIRGHRKTGTGENSKEPHAATPNADNIIGANRPDHQRFRRALANGFSARTMQEQEPIIKSYVDSFIRVLHEECADGKEPLNVEQWLNFLTFDIVGDLAFGESFGCLAEKKYNPWVRHIFKGIKDIAYMTNFGRIPWLAKILKLFTPKSVSNKWAEHKEISSEKVRKRLAMEYERPDFVDSMVKKTKSAGSVSANIQRQTCGGILIVVHQDITFDELASNAQLIVLAGSETTATLLSATTYYLTTHPDILAKLNSEVRSAFTTENEIDMISVSKLPYMLAILNESLRMFPPVVNGIPRLIGPGGDTIIGQYIPGGVRVLPSPLITLRHVLTFITRRRWISGTGLSIVTPTTLHNQTTLSQTVGSEMLDSIMISSKHYNPSPSVHGIASERSMSPLFTCFIDSLTLPIVSLTLRCGSF